MLLNMVLQVILQVLLAFESYVQVAVDDDCYDNDDWGSDSDD